MAGTKRNEFSAKTCVDAARRRHKTSCAHLCAGCVCTCAAAWHLLPGMCKAWQIFDGTLVGRRQLPVEVVVVITIRPILLVVTMERARSLAPLPRQEWIRLIRLPRSGQPRFRHGTTLTPHTAFSRPTRLMMGEDRLASADPVVPSPRGRDVSSEELLPLGRLHGFPRKQFTLETCGRAA